MSSFPASVSLTASYTSPGGVVSRPSFSVTATYSASADGFIDIPAATAPATEFVVPFGSVASPKCVIIQNLAQVAISLFPNGATGSSGIGTVGPSGCSMPVFAASGSSLSSLKFVCGATSATAAQVSYVVLGD